jgi:hypothetical protein
VIFVRATVHENNERWCSGSDIRYGIAGVRALANVRSKPHSNPDSANVPWR